MAFVENHHSSTKIYRFKVNSQELYQEMIDFSSLHKFEDKQTLKESFNNWLLKPNIEGLIEGEEQLLKRSQYDFEKTNMKHKIFRSIKYYHIKNMLKTETQETNTQKKRIKKIVFSKEFLNEVKTYLTKNVENENFKPALYFDYFCDVYSKSIESEKNNIQQKLDENYDEEEFIYKLKKMFKNQYFSMFKA